MDFHHKEILKRYARMATGRPFAPILLNILITSVCDMRCVHCFFTEELDVKPRKKLQMTTQNLIRTRFWVVIWSFLRGLSSNSSVKKQCTQRISQTDVIRMFRRIGANGRPVAILAYRLRISLWWK